MVKSEIFLVCWIFYTGFFLFSLITCWVYFMLVVYQTKADADKYHQHVAGLGAIEAPVQIQATSKLYHAKAAG